MSCGHGVAVRISQTRGGTRRDQWIIALAAQYYAPLDAFPDMPHIKPSHNGRGTYVSEE
jgi:hypothetical protein